jgi:hypothetical protein
MGTMRERQREVQLYRGQVPSPGRPTVAWREDRVRFWEAIARGVMTEDAAVEAGVSSPVAFRWFRHAGGACPPTCRAATCRSPSARTSRSHGRGASVCGRSLAGWAGARRRSRGSFAATRPRARGDSSTRHRSRSGTPSAELVGRGSPSWRRTSGCATTCRTGSPASFEHLMAERSALRVLSGRAATSLTAGIAVGCRDGARSRSPDVFGSTSPMMSPCGSATRRSTRPSTSRAEGPSAGNWPPACAPGGHCASRDPEPARSPGRT